MTELHPEAVGLCLNRITPAGRHTRCEGVIFKRGRAGVELVLRRAAISGRVEIEGEIRDHFADVLIDQNGTWDQVVALDANSYRSLKNHWMRCKVIHD